MRVIMRHRVMPAASISCAGVQTLFRVMPCEDAMSYSILRVRRIGYVRVWANNRRSGIDDPGTMKGAPQ